MKYYNIKRKSGSKLGDDYSLWALAVKNKNTMIITHNLFKDPWGIYQGTVDDDQGIIAEEYKKDWDTLYTWTEISKKQYDRNIERINKKYIKGKFLEDL